MEGSQSARPRPDQTNTQIHVPTKQDAADQRAQHNLPASSHKLEPKVCGHPLHGEPQPVSRYRSAFTLRAEFKIRRPRWMPIRLFLKTMRLLMEIKGEDGIYRLRKPLIYPYTFS